MKHSLFLFLFLFLSTIGSAKVTLPSIFSDGMILQQNEEVKLWGKADSKSVVKVKLSWSDKLYSVHPDADGNWSVKVKTQPAGFDVHSLTIVHENSTFKINDILFGEVWLCSGQSNMEMKMRGWYGSPVKGGRQAIANSRNNYIRIFDVPKVVTSTEENNCGGKWKKADPSNVSMMSATGYFFGRQLFQTLNIPIALVTSHWGGASITAFMSKKSIQDFPQFKLPEKGSKKLGNMTPTAIYNAMIHPIAGFSIKGVIWYQGETDRKNPDLYRKLFQTMLKDWRAEWSIGDFPFIYAQIAPFDYPNEVGNSAYMREAQSLCQQENPNAYMISLTDVGEEHNIHPSEKETVGFRMAAKALDKVYSIEGICTDEPTYKSMSIQGNKIVLSFDHVDAGWTTYGQPVTQFFIAGEDKVFYPATAKLRRKEIEVYSEKVTAPVAVRYAFTDYAKGCLYNIEGCCASSFRTDHWKEEDCKYK